MSDKTKNLTFEIRHIYKTNDRIYSNEYPDYLIIILKGAVVAIFDEEPVD